MTLFAATTTLLLASIFILQNSCRAETPEEWTRIAQAELDRALKVEPIVKRPKNVVFFLGDGMGINTLTASRIYKGQLTGKKGEEGSLVFENFPHVGLSKTYNDDSQVPDSAGTATAFFTGQKAAQGVLGVNSYTKLSSCNSAQGNAISSIVQWAQEAGKATGIVTTTRITHATPAATYAHTPHRDWEHAIPAVSAKDMPEDDRSRCKDIARQLIEDAPGKNINVIFGGGRRGFWPEEDVDPGSVTVTNPTGMKGKRMDHRNLINEWMDTKKKEGYGDKSKLVANRAELDLLTPDNTDYVLGLFASDHMEYDIYRETNAPQQPTLSEMTKKAIEILSKKKDGFYLMVEGGRIDHAHHDGYAKRALHDTVAFDAAIQTALSMLPAEDTLFVVTADHSHVLSIGGYPGRGSSILKGMSDSISGYLANDTLPYLTLAYANGPGAARRTSTGGRRDMRHEKTEADDFQQDAFVPLSAETHGGEDVAIYAKGPFAHLFHSLHEQHYIPVAIDYAACYRSAVAPHCKAGKDSGSSTLEHSSFVVSTLLLLASLVRSLL